MQVLTQPKQTVKVADTIERMKTLRRQISGPVGFVPTMGYLHEGHLSLVRQARKDSEAVVVSIFVNPTQFGPSEDFQTYPRDMERDLNMLESENTDIVFAPDYREIYPDNYSSWVDVEKLTGVLEGKCRPGHFRGVTTIVAKLFNIVEPTKAYFGQKDAQQALVIKKMVADLNMNLEVVVAPTVRENDGLAMSSRNTYLNPQERSAATILYKSLKLAEQMWQGGERDAERLRREMTSLISREPLARIDYISIADTVTLEELNEIRGPALASLAVRIGRTRLIDNFILDNGSFR